MSAITGTNLRQLEGLETAGNGEGREGGEGAVPSVTEPLIEHARSKWEGTLVESLLSQGPGRLLPVEGMLLMYRGQYLFCYKEGDREMYKPLTGAALRAAFTSEPVDSGWLPPGTVRWGEGAQGKFAVRWIPPGVHRLLVEVDVPEPNEGHKKKGVHTKVEEVDVPLPGLVFLGVGRRYFIWAASGTSFDKAAAVFHAPLSNVWETGAICWGSSAPPEVSAETFGAACDLFFASTFNDHLMGKRCRSYPNDVRVQLLQLSGAGATEYPEGELLPFDRVYVGVRKVNIADVIDSYVLKGASSGG